MGTGFRFGKMDKPWRRTPGRLHGSAGALSAPERSTEKQWSDEGEVQTAAPFQPVATPPHLAAPHGSVPCCCCNNHVELSNLKRHQSLFLQTGGPNPAASRAGSFWKLQGRVCPGLFPSGQAAYTPWGTAPSSAFVHVLPPP